MAYKWDEMTPRERDELVWIKVIGGKKPKLPYIAVNFPKYSTDISASWEVVEKITSTKKSYDGQNQRWHMQMSHNWNGNYIVELREVLSKEAFYADCRTAPEAICKAALKAVGIEIE